MNGTSNETLSQTSKLNVNGCQSSAYVVNDIRIKQLYHNLVNDTMLYEQFICIAMLCNLAHQYSESFIFTFSDRVLETVPGLANCIRRSHIVKLTLKDTFLKQHIFFSPAIQNDNPSVDKMYRKWELKLSRLIQLRNM